MDNKLGRGLGRGLGSLLGGLEDEEVANIQTNEIEISLIDRNTDQPRKNFEPTALQELANSIKQHGVIQPIILVKKGTRYMIIAGERRFRAAKMVGLKTIPAIVREYTPKEIKEIGLLENIQREDLNPIECALGMKELMEKYSYTQEALADRLGKSRPMVANTLRLLNLCPEVIEMVASGKLSAGHARSLVVVTNPEVQLRLAKLAVTKKITVRDLEREVKNMQSPAKPKKAKAPTSLEMNQFVTNLERKLSTKVHIKGNETKGQIVINYYNKDDLDRIYEVLFN